MRNLDIDLALQNAGAKILGAGVATFAEVFAKGEVARGSGLTAKIGATTTTAQLDVKTTYDDGSVKMAVLSVLRPELAAGQSLDVKLAAGAVQAAPAIDLSQASARHSFTVDVVGQGGRHQIDVLDALRDALADGRASVWQTGALASQARVEVALEGSQRMVFDVTAFQGGGLKVDAQFNNDVAMGAEGGRVAYQVTARLDGNVVLRESVNQEQYQNWHESFATNERDGGQGLGDADGGWLNIRHDIANLAATGAVAHYDLTNGVSESRLAAWGNAAEARDFGSPLSSNGLQQYMPGTGGREDIGMTTAANAAWLMSQDPRAAAYAMGQAEAGSAIPWNFWDASNGSWLSVEDYPRLWTDGRGGTGVPGDSGSGGLAQQIGKNSGWTTDSAHQPDISYVPYLLTGERWMLDNLQAQAAWNIVNTWSDVRGAEGMIVVDGSQVRHSAWALRQLGEAAWASPEGSAEKAYFTAATNANWAWLVEQIPAWTAAQGEAHGWLPGTYGTAGALPPWQQDYFASTAIAAAAQGNADALTFLEWQSNFLVGRFTQEAKGFAEHDGAAYLIAIADPQTGVPYQSWAQIGAQTVANDWSNGAGWEHSQGDFAQLALATLAGIAHLTGSPEAIAVYNALLADTPPFTTAADFMRDPTSAIAAPVPASMPEVPVFVPEAPVSVPEVPVSVPEVPVSMPEAPVSVPEAPVSVPEAPVSGPKAPAGGGLEITPPAADDGGNVPLVLKIGAFGFVGALPDIVVSVDGVKMFQGEVTAANAMGELVIGHVAADVDHQILLSLPEQGQPGGVLFVSEVLLDGVVAGAGTAMMGHGEASLISHARDDVFAF